MEDSLMKDVLIPGARGDARKPIIPNITKHERKHSMGGIRDIDNSVQGHNYSVGLNTGRDYLKQLTQTNAAGGMQNSQSRFS
jgi:hypothetical protein